MTMILNLYAQNIYKPCGTIAFSEALSRFFDKKTKEQLQTSSIIRHLEQTGEIKPFDIASVKEISEKIKDNIAKEYKRIPPVSINISALSLKNASHLAEAIKGLEDYLILEVTETADATAEEIIKFSQTMKKAGVKLAIDDFNHSQDGFKLLVNLEPDYVKFVYEKIPARLFEEIDQVLEFNPNVQLIFENIEERADFETIINKYPTAYIQGYLLHKGNSFIPNIPFNSEN